MLLNHMIHMMQNLALKVIEFLYSIYFPAFISGCLLTLAYPPFNLLPVLFISVCVLYHLIDKTHTRKEAFKIGWVFGFGHYLTSLYWFCHALLTNPAKFGWMIPFALLLIPSVLGVYNGLVTLFTYHFKRNKLNKILAFSSCWVVVEILRTNFVIPFPWNLVGHSLIASLATAQITYFIGIFGGSFLLILSSCFISKEKTLNNILIIVLWSSILVVGFSRINFKETEFYDDFKIRLVQPFNLHHNGENEKRMDSVKRLVELSVLNRSDDLKYIIWPEASFPYGVFLERKYLQTLSNIAPRDGALILGSDRFVFSKDKKELSNIYNSIYAINSHNQILDVYDKSILVPYGEYIPFRAVLPNIPKVTDGILDFSLGDDSNHLFDIPGLPKFRSMICYEVIFPNIKINEDAKWILNITNDAWFGNSIGPYQHYGMAKIKAIESGLPMIRVANNGVTSVIDAYGEEYFKMNLGDMGYIDVELPKNEGLINHIYIKRFIEFVIFIIFFGVIAFEIWVKYDYYSKLKKWVLK